METAPYKEMYIKMFEAAERSINILIKAQRECEEMYMNSPEGEVSPLVRGPAKADAEEGSSAAG